jgi:predicted nucleic acid-binding Zn ribbon protein
MMSPEHIRAILERVVKGLDLERGMREQGAVLSWDEVVGERVACCTKAVAIRRSVLFVEVESSAWMHELVFLKPMIVKRLNERLGAGTVRDIVFSVVKRSWTGEGVNRV